MPPSPPPPAGTSVGGDEQLVARARSIGKVGMTGRNVIRRHASAGRGDDRRPGHDAAVASTPVVITPDRCGAEPVLS